MSCVPPTTRVPEPPLVLHHVALPCRDIAATASWYAEILGCSISWRTTVFAESTRIRMPGLRCIAELQQGSVRLHVYEVPTVQQFPGQHYCVRVAEPQHLLEVRRRAAELAADGAAEAELITDDEGVQSIYLNDPDGNELELTFIPSESER